MRRTRFALLLLSLAIVTSACATVRISDPQGTSATDPQSRTLWFFFWQEAVITPPNCQTHYLHRVATKTNLGYQILSVITLGIVQAAEVEWTCGPDPVLQPPSGPLGLRQTSPPEAAIASQQRRPEK